VQLYPLDWIANYCLAELRISFYYNFSTVAWLKSRGKTAHVLSNVAYISA